MRTSNTNNKNIELTDEDEPIKRVRINFKSPDDALRQLLLGFIPNNLATDGVDYGYDAINTDDLPNDMSWIIEDEKYIIQGVGDYDETKQYPLGIFLSQSGNIEISLNELENFDEEIDVFVYDALLDNYILIDTSASFNINLNAGEYLDRFFIAFTQSGILSTSEQNLQAIVVNYLNKTNDIYIKIPTTIQVKQVYLINMLGQTIKSWNMTNTTLSHEMRIPVKHIAEGNYIIKVTTTTGTTNKKVIVTY